MIEAIPIIAKWLSVLLFAAALVLGLRRGVRQLAGTQPYIPIREQGEMADYYTIFTMVAVGSVFVYAFGMWFNAAVSGYEYTSFADLFEATFMRSDAPHYLDIAEYGYQTEGDPRFFIVFFPLFPWLVRVLQLFVGNYIVAAVLLNNVLLLLACFVIYEIGCLDYGRKNALRAVRYLLLFPTAFFFRSAYTESLFLLLTALALYCCRKERFVLAGLLGLLATLTRMTGLIVLGVIIIEAFIKAWDFAGGFNRGFIRHFAKRAWPFILVICGILLYFLLNKVVTGDAFKFSEYQKEHWFNEFRLFHNQVETITRYMITVTEPRLYGHWISQAIAVLAFLPLMIYGAVKLRVSHTAYNIAYYLGTISVSWLLSAPRYLMCMFPAFYALAMLGENKAVDIVFSVLLFAGQVVLTALFCSGFPIY